MALIVQKFGGTSVSDIDCIKRVAQIVQRTRDQGHDVVVVVSAMAGETDRLIALARSLTSQPAVREYDALLSTGEQVAAALLSMELIANQCPARSYTGHQAGIMTDSRHKKASILSINTALLADDLQERCVPVITGFQGADKFGHITTLGRGGSDTTAVALAAALKAEECQIFTDVQGVFTSDPRIVRLAQPLAHLTFDEMLELSRLGAKVLQIHSVEYAHKHNVALRVLSTFDEGPGTLVTSTLQRAVPFVSGIAFDKNQVKFSILGIPNKPDYTAEIIKALQAASIEMDMVMDNRTQANGFFDFSFTVSFDDSADTDHLTTEIAKTLQAREVVSTNGIAKISLIGMGMKSHAGVAATMLQTLAKEGIHIQSIVSSEVTISAIIDEKYMELGARILHNVFGLDKIHEQ